MKDGIIYWNVDPEIFTILDTFPIRYYSLFWVLGIGLGYFIVKKIYQKEKIPVEHLDQLAMYILIGAFLGMRLGHCFFYEPQYYLHNPLEIILPIKKVGESFEFIGFQGLASHGGVFGAIIGIVLYSRKTNTNFLWVLDRVAIGGAVTATFIRIGNLMNSEIYGKPTNGNWGFVFERDDLIPRHPTQIYEALSYFLIFGVLVLIYRLKKVENKNGILIGTLLILLFTARFVVEFFKENQVGFEDSMALNMGQILSIPFIILGLIIIYWRGKSST
ncbi:prolipoprotein diacylglyceryl transferase [Maribacter halichondriae]|uniref:prolipoprotein diacylglyceryl transferase n=1 Tax=Maribacter halichondriae TaxID=2980554 RepID=UPI0023592C6D|nr:prolipoprotein diacylglyceryl transferase [Maribacter sp. Hal144]